MTDLIGAARDTLRANDTGAFIKPSLGQYPHQWNWDAAFIALGLATFDMPRAREEVCALLRGQWRSGMVPHILYHAGASDYFPTPDFWRTEGRAAIPTSGLTQPPILATAVRRLHQRARDREASLAFVREVYPKVLAWHRWLYRARDPEGTGLVAILHPWESGMDNSTRWTRALERVTPVNVPSYTRRDQQHVTPDERPLASDYERFMYLIGLFRDLRWDEGALYARSPFLVRDAFFNALLHRANFDLRALALELGEPTGEIDGWLSLTRRAFAGLWHEETGLYHDFDVRANALMEENTCAALAPLYAGLPDDAQARRLVEHLTDPEEYAPDARTRYYLPSVAKSSPYFEPRRYWRGPVWLNINWLVLEGLKRYGYPDLAEAVKAHTLALAATSGFAEYYDPRDGSPCGARGFSWSAALVLDLLA